MIDDDRAMAIDEWRASLEIRKGYERRRVREWTKDECLLWLFNYGAFDCGMSYCDVDGLRSEVLLVKAESGK